MKTLVAGALVAATMALALPEPASAIGIVIGPRGGVGVRVGRPYGYRRPFIARRPVVVVPRRGYYGPRVYRRY